MTAAKEAPRAETELLKSEMDQLQKDLKNFADREESLTKQVNELTTEKEEAKNQENEHMQSLEEEISILSQQEEQYQGKKPNNHFTFYCETVSFYTSEQIKKLENDNSNMSKVVKGAELKAKKDIEQFKTESNEVIKNLKNENAATEKQFEDFKKDSEKTIQDKFCISHLFSGRVGPSDVGDIAMLITDN